MVRSHLARIPPPNADFLTDLIPGNTLNIELFEPASKKGASTLHIRKVVHAYKNLFQSISESFLNKSGDCNNDINCYSKWDKPSDAVAKVLLSNGTELCSGSLLNNTAQNFRPFFLSAFHCIDSDKNGSLSISEKNDAENWMFKFQYKVTECNGNTVRTTYTYSRADFRAAWNTSDFALMELKNTPLRNSEITWLGWDKSSSTPSEGTGIHHPKGDVMKISFDENKLKETSWRSNSGSNYWRVIWDNGVTEGGSSGSPLLDNNKRVVGQLKGGFAACGSSDLRDWYGAFHSSWTGGGTKETQLKHWLDPCGTNPGTVNTVRSPYISGSTPLCTSFETYTLHNVPSGSSVTWSATPTSLFTNTSGSGSSFSTAWDGSGSGSGTITATLRGECGSVDITKDIWVGLKPDFSGPSSVPYQGSGTWSSTSSCNPSGYEWFLLEAGTGYGSELVGTGEQLTLHSMPRLNPMEVIPHQPINYTEYYLSLRISDEGGETYTTDERRIIAYGDVDLISLFRSEELSQSTNNTEQLKVYPNPATNQVKLTVNSSDYHQETFLNESSGSYLSVFNAYGLPMVQREFDGESMNLNVSGWQKGLYYVVIKTKQGNITATLLVE